MLLVRHRSVDELARRWRTAVLALLLGRRARPLLKDWQVGLAMLPFALLAGFGAGYLAHHLVDLLHHPPGHCVPQGVARCTDDLPRATHHP